MKSWHLVGFGLLLGLTASALLFLITSPPRGTPIQLSPFPTPVPPQVYVTGEVVQPGVYQLPAGSRIEDAIQAAGGLTLEADEAGINLARLVVDGMQISVPPRGMPASEASDRPGEQNLSLEFPININSATPEQLMLLPGIGLTRAQDIIAYRDNEGPFVSIKQIQEVPGIGEGIYNQIKDLITTGSGSP
jgi:competence protein ComEA